MNPGLNIKAVTELTGVSHHTLRAWEKRYRAVTPERSPNGRRLYQMDDVERIRILRTLTEQGHAISGIATLGIDDLRTLLQPTASRGLGESPSGADEGPSLARVFEHLADDLRGYRLDSMERTLTLARANFPARVLVLRLFGPLLQHIGLEVAAGRLDVAQEHALSALLRNHLGQLYQDLRRTSAESLPGYRIAFTTRAGDLHEFGILMGAILALLSGIRTEYLGPNLPAAEIAKAANGFGCTHVVLGLTGLDAKTGAADPAKFLKELDAALPSRLGLWAGGAPESEVSLTSGRVFRWFHSLEDFLTELARLNGHADASHRV